MIKGNFPRNLYEALAIHEFLRQLGYTNDEISLNLSNGDVGVIVKANGKTGNLRIGTAELPQTEMIKKWKELSVEWNKGGTMSQEEADMILHSSKVFAHRELTKRVLLGSGFNRWLN